MSELDHRHTIHGSEERAHDLLSLETDLRKLLAGKLEGRSHLQTLNLACGRADETGVLAKLVNEKTNAAHIQGMDLRSLEISGAQELWGKEIPKIVDGVQCDFMVGKGDQLDTMNEMANPDLLFIRHQNYWFDQKAWVKLYDQALKKLRNDGVMVITSYFDEEHEMARAVLISLGAVEISHRFKPEGRVVKDSVKVVKSVDRHISVFVKA